MSSRKSGRISHIQARFRIELDNSREGDSKNNLHVNSGTSGPRSSSGSDKYGLCQLQPAVCRDSLLEQPQWAL